MMIDFQYLYRGICGLARAHRAGSLSGHLGAAVAAGYFFGENQPDLDDKVYKAIEGNLRRILGGEESIWFNAQKAGISISEMFQPFPKEPSHEQLIDGVAKALAGNISKTRQSGHNVIFASIAIRGLRDHSDYATASIVDGVVKLIAAFNNAGPGRGYYGKKRGWLAGDQVSLSGSPDLPPYRDLPAMVDVVIGDLIRWGSARRRGFGGLFHIINHAAGLLELSMFGYKNLALRGLAAHHQHLRLWRSLPILSEELGKLMRAEEDPRTPAYWSREKSEQHSAWLTHRIKTLYGFFTLLRFVDDEATRAKALEQFGYLMA